MDEFEPTFIRSGNILWEMDSAGNTPWVKCPRCGKYQDYDRGGRYIEIDIDPKTIDENGWEVMPRKYGSICQKCFESYIKWWDSKD